LHRVFPEVALLVTESNPQLLRPLVEVTYIIERGEIAPEQASLGGAPRARSD
jgi:branched-chain amino acid transport system ATP-binding protein